MAISPTLREEFKTTLKVSAYTTLCAGSIKASKKLVETLAKSAKKRVLQKTFTKSEMKEILSSKANDNFRMNDNNVYMSKGKVVGGENFDVGTVSSNIDGGVPGSRVSVKPYNSQTAMDKKIDVLKKKSVESKDHKLLPGECEVGTYGELIARGEKWDNLTPDHIPSAAYMKKHFGVSKKDGVAMNMEHPHPGTGGRHRQSRTYGKPATDNPLKTEIYLDVSNRIDIYKKERLYGSKVRKGLLNVIEENRKRFPEEFKKRK